MPSNFALLLIDMQRGLCEGAEAAFDAQALVVRLNALAKKARTSKVPVLWVHHEEAEGALEHGSAGWQLALGLETDVRDILVRKDTPDAFLRTGLGDCSRPMASMRWSFAACKPNTAWTPPPAALWVWACQWCWCLTATRRRTKRICRRNRSLRTTTPR